MEKQNILIRRFYRCDQWKIAAVVGSREYLFDKDGNRVQKNKNDKWQQSNFFRLYTIYCKRSYSISSINLYSIKVL